MPFKRNPFTSEKICSLARYVNFLPAIALENASSSLLERTLDDSANKRVIIAGGFLAVDEILITSEKIINGMLIFEDKIRFNLSQYGPFSATELVIIEAVKKGADRQKIHEVIREISFKAWQEIQQGKRNSIEKLLIANKKINKFLSLSEVRKTMDITQHIGDAPQRALRLAKMIRKIKK